MMQSTDLYISWGEYHRLIEALAVQVYDSGWTFDQILCLARGGLRIGDLLSRIFNRPLAILAASSYCGDDFRTRGSIRFSQSLTMATPNLGDRILLVDDLVDSGTTILQTLLWLQEHYQIEPQNCRTAVLWYKGTSEVKPDYYIEYLPQNPWIHQPFESYENQDTESLIAAFQRTGAMLNPSKPSDEFG